MLAAFNSREARIDAQEMAIENRMQALKLADAEVARKLDELVQAESDLRDTLALSDTAAEGDLDKLTKVYETMKPKQAAALKTAYARGYYDWPRKSSAEELAETLDISAPSLHYRLRKAHDAVIGALFDAETSFEEPD